ncbi:protein kinase STUNTED-like [Typha angustifolia]|uniref:protein kinase STUNTED-like n=1 Tax=Typha angustifolia TaxID=59011 RepID=UPI003C2D08D9
MTVEDELLDRKAEGNCILVGLQMDAAGRDLINWALTKVAKQGDRVVAVHICRKSDLSKTSTLSLIKVLDEYLLAYEFLCKMKQITLVGRVTPGSSIQKVLVKEAKLCAAMAVLVGVNKNFSFGGPSSLAKYMARKLPPTTGVIAIHNGKVIFEREATKPPSGGDRKPVLGSLLHPSVGMDPKVVVPNRKGSPDKKTAGPTEVGHGGSVQEEGGSTSSSITVLVKRLPEQRLGWPLLRRASSIETPKGEEVRKLSVVQWVMNLPSRSSPSSTPQGELINELKHILEANSSSCKWFRYEELHTSTNQFSAENLIGKGGTSQVYRGCLPNGQQVAIKLSKLSAEASRDLLLEVDIVTKLRHKQMVPLIGICIEDNSFISIYSYLSKGSLEENLHGKRSKPPLSWNMRFKAAIGIAEVLTYLHTECSQPVIHRDVKSSNILLTDDFEPQLSDFGLAIWAPPNSSSITHSDVVGTFGYLAPEYFMYGKISNKIDVYAFGVVLLELLTGRKPISDDNPKGQESLVMWATPILNRGEVMDLLDPSLDGKYDEIQMRRMVLAASLCITRAARLRPQMIQILRLLEGENIRTGDNSENDTSTNELDCMDDETYPVSSVSSHLGLALLDVEDAESISSFEHSNLSSLEEYLRGRWSRSSSFD